MDSLHYLIQKSLSNSNKNLEILPKFFSKDEHRILSQRSVSIVGTNGKTTTATILNEILSQQGLKSVLFTSPHLVKLNERIQINQKSIKDLELDEGMQRVMLFEEENNIVLGYFESIFLIATKNFLNHDFEVFISEAGIGGRLDTTSILNSQTVCLTNIGFDHTELLGETLEEILYEKILISKNVRNLIVGSKKVDKDYKFLIKEALQIEDDHYFSGFKKNNSKDLINDISKSFIKSNQETAFETSKVFLSNLKQYDNLKKNSELSFDVNLIKPDGRFQVIKELPELKIIDGAHNPSGIEAFFELLDQSYNLEKIDCYIGFNQNKDFGEMLKVIWMRDNLNIKILEDKTFFKQLESVTLEKHFISNNQDFSKSTLKEFHFAKKPSILLGSLYLVGEYIKEYK